MTCSLTVVRHEVNNLESYVVVRELELAINLALNLVHWSIDVLHEPYSNNNINVIFAVVDLWNLFPCYIIKGF